MLQRIQSIFFLVAALLSFSLLFFDFWKDQLLLISMSIIVGVINLITIFLYKNRLLQMKIGKMSILLTGLLLFGSMYVYLVTQFEKAAWSTWIGMMIIMLVVFFTSRAIRAIAKDEMLVRDADRIR